MDDEIDRRCRRKKKREMLAFILMRNNEPEGIYFDREDIERIVDDRNISLSSYYWSMKEIPIMSPYVGMGLGSDDPKEQLFITGPYEATIRVRNMIFALEKFRRAFQISG